MNWLSKIKRHFRGHKTKVKGKVKIHPSYIVGEDKKHFFSFGITSDNKKGKRHSNHKLSKNPKIGDNSPSYVRKQMEIRSKAEYTRERWNNYRMSDKDDDYIDNLLISKGKK